MSNPLHMWKYWKNDKGIEEALESYYPEVLKSDPILQAAFAQYKMAKLAIDARMKQLADAVEDEEEN